MFRQHAWRWGQPPFVIAIYSRQLETGQACFSTRNGTGMFVCLLDPVGSELAGADPDMLLNATGSDPDMSSARNRTGMFLCLLDPAGSDPDMLIPAVHEERRGQTPCIALGSDTVRHCYLFTPTVKRDRHVSLLVGSGGVRPRHVVGSVRGQTPTCGFRLCIKVTPGSDSVHSVGSDTVRH